MATIARRGISAATKADEKLRQHGFCILRDVESRSRSGDHRRVRGCARFRFRWSASRHPEAPQRKLIALYVELTAGPELARLAYPDLFYPAAPQP